MATRRKSTPQLPRPRFFATPAAWRKWLAANHATKEQLWVGFWRVGTGKRCISWPESVDEALCFGWIDGLRRGIDADSYVIRFTPRKATSRWSRNNLKRFAELEAKGAVHRAGKAARGQWDDSRSSGYSHDTPQSRLDAAGVAKVNANARARRFWEAQTPSYRKVAGHWVVSAKREATRAARLKTLVDCCARGAAIPPLAKWVKVKRPSPG
jgi:uncharacterized protein YdeI (YjbR/CyaY-like superfamily)